MASTRRVVVLGLALMALAGCESTTYDEPAGEPSQDVRDTPADEQDPEPERLDGYESQEFEEDDIEAARDADLLVEHYCNGVESEAQYEGCLSHVYPEDVCEQNTDGKVAALEEYIAETGDEAICE